MPIIPRWRAALLLSGLWLLFGAARLFGASRVHRLLARIGWL